MTPSAPTQRLLETLIAFPTVSRDSNLGLIEWVRDELAAQGIRCRLTYDNERRKANLFATLAAGDASGGIVLSGHTDVVPVDGQDWSRDPFKPAIIDGKVYGRGSADMKGFIAVVLAAVPEMIGKPFHLPSLTGTGDERRESRQHNADLVMAYIAGLLPVAYRGVYVEQAIAPDHRR